MNEDPPLPAPIVKAGDTFARNAPAAVLGVLLVAALFACIAICSGVAERSRYTPLQRAAVGGDVSTCERLVAAGAAIDAPDDRGITALGYAVCHQRTEVVQALLALGAQVNHPDREGRTPLTYTTRSPFGKGSHPASTRAARRGIATLLLAHGADVHHATNGGDTALHGAVLEGDPTLVRMLLDAGADPHVKTEQGYTAIDIAKFPAFAPNDEIIAALEARARQSSRSNGAKPPRADRSR